MCVKKMRRAHADKKNDKSRKKELLIGRHVIMMHIHFQNTRHFENVLHLVFLMLGNFEATLVSEDEY